MGLPFSPSLLALSSLFTFRRLSLLRSLFLSSPVTHSLSPFPFSSLLPFHLDGPRDTDTQTDTTTTTTPRLPISSLPLGRFQPSGLVLQSYSPASELAARRGVCTDGSRWPTEPAAWAGRGWASARAQAGSPRGEAGAQPGGVSPPHARLRSGRGEPPNLTGSGPAPAPGERTTRRPSFLPGAPPGGLRGRGTLPAQSDHWDPCVG